MKVRFTPFSIVAALFILFALLFVFSGDISGKFIGYKVAMQIAVTGLILIVVDIIIRVFAKTLARIWIIETVLIFVYLAYGYFTSYSGAALLH